MSYTCIALSDPNIAMFNLFPDKSSDSFNDIEMNGTERKKKARTVFTRQQIQQLESAFDKKKYFTNSERQKLASDLMLSETQVRSFLAWLIISNKILIRMIWAAVITKDSFFFR